MIGATLLRLASVETPFTRQGFPGQRSNVCFDGDPKAEVVFRQFRSSKARAEATSCR